MKIQDIKGKSKENFTKDLFDVMEAILNKHSVEPLNCFVFLKSKDGYCMILSDQEPLESYPSVISAIENESRRQGRI